MSELLLAGPRPPLGGRLLAEAGAVRL